MQTHSPIKCLPVGNTVDLSTGAYTNDIGAQQLPGL
jgi:hypothetical protein